MATGRSVTAQQSAQSNMSPQTVSTMATQGNIRGAPATKDDVRLIHLVMTGVVIGLFSIVVAAVVAYAPIAIDAFNEKKESYDSLRDKLDAQNEKINQLKVDIEVLKVNAQSNSDTAEPVPATP